VVRCGKNNRTAESQRNNKREKFFAVNAFFQRVYILGFSFVMLTHLVNVSFIFLKMFTGCFFDGKFLGYLAVNSSLLFVSRRTSFYEFSLKRPANKIGIGVYKLHNKLCNVRFVCLVYTYSFAVLIETLINHSYGIG